MKREKKILIILLSPYSSLDFRVLPSVSSCSLLYWRELIASLTEEQEYAMPETIPESELTELMFNV